MFVYPYAEFDEGKCISQIRRGNKAASTVRQELL